MAPHNVILAGIFPTGGGEWIVILVIVLVLFGGAKLPSLARGLGQSIREFKKASKDEDPPVKDASKPDTAEAEGKKSPATTPSDSP